MTIVSRRTVLAISGAAAATLATPRIARAQAELRLRYAHSQPIDHSTHIAAEAFVSKVAELSDGKIVIDLFPNNQLGVDRELQGMIESGSIDFTHTNSATLAGFVPEANVMNFPFIWQDADHYMRTVDGPFGDALNAITAPKSGHRFIAWWFDGFRNVYTRDREVRTLEDMAGLKIRSPQSPIFVETFRALGANPTPLAFPEIYSALEAGVIDGFEGSNGIIWASQLQEVTDYRVVTGHIMVGFGLVIAEKTFAGLSDDAKAIIAEAALEAERVQRELQLGAEDELARKFVEEGGMTETRPDLSAFREAVKPVIERFSAELGDTELLALIEAEI